MAQEILPRETALTSQQQEMLEINKDQSRYYEVRSLKKQGNWVTQLWTWGRHSNSDLSRKIGVYQSVCDLHWKWMGDLSGKHVLDLGCHSGNELSIPIAERCGSYLGVDLSRTGIDLLKAKLEARQIPHARALAVDFLSPEMPDETFDVIYAYSVAHHFKHFEAFLEKLASHLKPGGIVVTIDPLQTFWPMRFIRGIYRAFQSDADWEWPFTAKSLAQIQRYFRIVELQGVMGSTKWSWPFLFVNKNLAVRLGTRFHQRDLRFANGLNRSLWRCLRVTMCLTKP